MLWLVDIEPKVCLSLSRQSLGNETDFFDHNCNAEDDLHASIDFVIHNKTFGSIYCSYSQL